MAKTKCFFDLEFTGLHKLTTAISIGLVAEDGKKYYAEFTDFDKYQIDDFLRKEVLSKRILGEYNPETDYKPDSDLVLVKGDIDTVYATMLKWLEQYKEDGVEMWGDLLAYDWVLFVGIFGNGLALPKFIDYIPMDLCTALKLMGEDKDVDRDVFAYGKEKAQGRKEKKHNALYDAETQMEVYKKLMAKISRDVEEKEEEEEDLSAKEELQEIIKEIDEAEQREHFDMTGEEEEKIKQQIADDEAAVAEVCDEEEIIGGEKIPPMAILLSEEEKNEETAPPIKEVVEKVVEKKKAGRPPSKKKTEKKK